MVNYIHAMMCTAAVAIGTAALYLATLVTWLQAVVSANGFTFDTHQVLLKVGAKAQNQTKVKWEVERVIIESQRASSHGRNVEFPSPNGLDLVYLRSSISC